MLYPIGQSYITQQYIATNARHTSRYDIDRHLLGEGFEPEQIEESWQDYFASLVDHKRFWGLSLLHWIKAHKLSLLLALIFCSFCTLLARPTSSPPLAPRSQGYRGLPLKIPSGLELKKEKIDDVSLAEIEKAAQAWKSLNITNYRITIKEDSREYSRTINTLTFRVEANQIVYKECLGESCTVAKLAVTNYGLPVEYIFSRAKKQLSEKAEAEDWRKEIQGPVNITFNARYRFPDNLNSSFIMENTIVKVVAFDVLT